MQRNIIIPLVVTLILCVLASSTTLFILKTRDNNSNTLPNSEVNDKKNVSNSEQEMVIEKEKDKIEENKSDDNAISNIKPNNNSSIKPNNNSSIKTQELSKESKNDSKKDNGIKTETQKESNDQKQTIIDVPKEDTKKNNDITQDEEYQKIKSTCEFFSREECQSALTDIELKYLDDDHEVVSASCKSFAYKGQIVGYRVLLTYGDGKFFYNN